MELFLDMYELSPASILQTYFVTAALAFLMLRIVPTTRNSGLLAYGSRNVQSEGQEKDQHAVVQGSETNADTVKDSMIMRFLRSATVPIVPHGWFYQYYAFSLLSGCFWLQQLSSKGALFDRIARQQIESSGSAVARSMSASQVLLTITLVMLHSTRRLFESLEFAKSSKSSMTVVQWLFGFTFFVALNIGTWIHGVAELSLSSFNLNLSSFSVFAYIPMPSLRTLCCLPIFLISSGVQHDCHNYLANLRKYTLPKHPAFKSLICPHYTAECVIYLSLALIAAPSGTVINLTLLSTLFFTVVNLGVTADDTRDSYMRRFGKSEVQSKWRMIPWVW